MNNEYYGVASTPTDDFLAHYGIKGMKWGVRKAIQRGDDRALSRQYRKAEKKLAKLERLSNGSKYAKRATRYGLGAAAMGGLAAIGTPKNMNSAIAKSVAASNRLLGGNAATKIARLDAGKKAMEALNGRSPTVNQMIAKGAANSNRLLGGNAAAKTARLDAGANLMKKANEAGIGGRTISNATALRIGAGALGAGLGLAAIRNQRRAMKAGKRAEQAKQFRAEMNKTFAGTKYANGRPASQKKKRR